MAFSDEVLADSPAAYWQFRDVGATQTDASGNGFPQTLQGGPTTQQPSLTGEVGDFAVEFDPAAFQWSEASTPTSLHNALDITLEWLGTVDTPNALGETLCIWVTTSSGSSFNTQYSGAGIYTTDTETRCYVSDGDNGQGRGVFAPININDGQPHHLVVAANSAGIEFYVDGASVGTNTFTAGIWAREVSSLTRIAGHAFQRNLDGRTCEAAVYQSRLSTARIQAHAAEVGFFPPGADSKLPTSFRGFLTGAQAALPTRLLGLAAGAAANLPMRLEAPDPAHFTADTAFWGIDVQLDGADISDRIVGPIRIEHSEDASGIASFLFVPNVGAIDPAVYERRPVTITFVGRGQGGGVQYTQRRFTGLSSSADYDPDAGILSIDCTTDLQGAIEVLDKETITAIAGGLWSEHIFEDSADSWQYLRDRLSTIASEIHHDVYRHLVVVPWAAKTTPDLTLTDAERFNDSLQITRVEMRDLITRVRINLDFRFTRLRHRILGVHLIDNEGFCDYLNRGWRLAGKDMIRAASDGSGWTRQSPISFTDLPVPGTYCTPQRGWVGGADDFCLGAFWQAARRWAQTVTEQYALDVISPDLEEAVSRQPINEDYGISATYDSTDYEAITEFSGPPDNATLSPKTGDWQVDGTEEERDGRLAMEEAQRVALAKAETTILGRARRNRVSVSNVYRPDLSLAMTVRINTPYCTAKGKVAKFTETLDPINGALTQTIEIAISRHNGTGLPAGDPLDPAPAPDQPQETVGSRQYYMQHRIGGTLSSVPESDDLDGWMTNVSPGSPDYDPTAPAYRERFVVRMPEIEAEARDASDVQAPQTYEIQVPEDELILSR